MEEQATATHYTHGNLLSAIKSALAAMGKNTDTLQAEALAPVDEFHIGGREATVHFVNQLGFSTQNQVLDLGCGLGGAARFVAVSLGVEVTGLDLTEEYVETGNTLNGWVGLDKQVVLHQGSILNMPFPDRSFDGAYMMHVGMNIKEKALLFEEVFRVLRPGARFGIYDIMTTSEGAVEFPVPWAADASMSFVDTPAHYMTGLKRAGFDVLHWESRDAYARDFFAKQQQRSEPPPLGLHTLIGPEARTRFANLVSAIEAGILAPVELFAEKAK